MRKEDGSAQLSFRALGILFRSQSSGQFLSNLVLNRLSPVICELEYDLLSKQLWCKKKNTDPKREAKDNSTVKITGCCSRGHSTHIVPMSLPASEGTAHTWNTEHKQTIQIWQLLAPPLSLKT